MATTTPPTSPPIWWRVHDILVGFLAGFGVGTVAGLFLNTQIGDNVVVLITAAVGAAIGIYVLIRNHQRSSRFLSAVVVVSWVLLILSTVFIALLIWAVATFE
ncbi:MAG: hypothetical protein ACRDZM_05305 [Acidimicrobiia bacterium]